LPVNENWLGSKLIERCVNCNWERTAAGGSPGTGNGGIITDQVKGQRNFVQTILNSVPAHPLPLCPGNNCKAASVGKKTVQIHCWSGTVAVGSDVVGDGEPIMDLIWRRFQDHARHCNIFTGSNPKPLNPCSCPGTVP